MMYEELIERTFGKPKWTLDEVASTMVIAPARHSGKSEIMDEWMRSYVNNDIQITKDLFNLYKKEKENKTMLDDRTLMNSLKKGMYVEVLSDKRGYIEAFDYTHLRVGIRVEGTPSYTNLAWLSPGSVRIIAMPDGKAVPRFDSRYPKPKKVIYDEDAGVTVVLWEDGQKTIVRAAEGEDLDIYDAFCAAYCKRIYGSNSALKRELNKVLVVKEKPKQMTFGEIVNQLDAKFKSLKTNIETVKGE